MRDIYSDCCVKFPELVYDILDYFSDTSKVRTIFANDTNIGSMFKCFLDFIHNYRHKYQNNEGVLQPDDFEKICNILCDKKMLSKICPANYTQGDGMGTFYWRPNRTIFSKPELKMYYIQKFNSIVFGFRYIYENHKNNVLPLFVKLSDREEPHIGTCFFTNRGLITAKHCLQCKDYNTEWVAIGDRATGNYISIDALNNKNLQANISDKYDVAVIDIGDSNPHNNFWFADANVLDEVVGLGYPAHAGFNNFLTATLGTIAAIEPSYIYKHTLIMTTGKLKGGNSGGPLVNKEGDVVGVLTEEAMPEGDYDKFGYGLAIPLSNVIIKEILDEKNTINIPFHEL